jgi:hypothetical protein
MADNCTVVLQNCMDLEKHVPGPCSETYPTSSHDVNQGMTIKVEEVSDVEVEEKRAVPMTFVRIKAEHEVSSMSVCPLLANFTHDQNCLLSLSSTSVCRYCSGYWILKSPF